MSELCTDETATFIASALLCQPLSYPHCMRALLGTQHSTIRFQDWAVHKCSWGIAAPDTNRSTGLCRTVGTGESSTTSIGNACRCPRIEGSPLVDNLQFRMDACVLRQVRFGKRQIRAISSSVRFGNATPQLLPHPAPPPRPYEADALIAASDKHSAPRTLSSAICFRKASAAPPAAIASQSSSILVAA